MRKEGSANVKFFVSVLFLAALMLFVAFAVNVELLSSTLFGKPIDNELNASRVLNFTFNATWFNIEAGSAAANCSLWTNFTGTWNETRANSTTTATITNSSLSWINHTFNRDLSNFVWAIGCYNDTSAAAVLNFTSNRTLGIDAGAPRVLETLGFFGLFNTSSATPTMTFNITDINGTGINITTTGGHSNATLNVTIYNVNAGEDAAVASIRNITIVNSSIFTCDAGDAVGVQNTQCTLSGVVLTNGTKNITIRVTDRVFNFNFTSFTFTVDNIPPVLIKFNITNGSAFNYTGGQEDNDVKQLGYLNGSGADPDSINLTQGGPRLYAIANFTDNLTKPHEADLQFYNTTSLTWVTVNTTKNFQGSNISPSATNSGGMVNLTFSVPIGHNEFEGANISFKLRANDSVSNYGNLNGTTNITIFIKDATKPTITINGTVAVNRSNLTNQRPIVSWSIIEKGNNLDEINVSVDGAVDNNNGCNKFARYKYTVTSGINDVENKRNDSFQISEDILGTQCILGNGTHFIEVKAVDQWGNLETVFHNFTIQALGAPGLQFSFTGLNGINGTFGKTAENKSNITKATGINLTGINGPGASVDRITYISSCDSSTTVTITNGTVVFPFNGSSCLTQSENRTLTVTINDTAGNSNTTILGFLVDNVAPTIAVHSPTEGQTFNNTQAVLNVSVQDEDQGITYIGFYDLDADNKVVRLVDLNVSPSSLINNTGFNLTSLNTSNLTGTRKIIFTVNDSLNNQRNSSIITFTQTGTQNMLLNATIKNSLGVNNVSNVSFLDVSGAVLETAAINQTLQLFVALNGSVRTPGLRGGGANISVYFNGSAANWNLTTEIFITLNDSAIAGHVQNNQSTTVIDLIYVNNSFAKFLPDNNSYYGKVKMGLNVSTLGGGYSLLYFPDEADHSLSMASANITECTAGFTPSFTFTSACWNHTPRGKNLSVDIYIPHFSTVVLSNDSTVPTITPITPSFTFGNHTVSMFVPNITVSSDTESCSYDINATGDTKGNQSMIKDSTTTCLGQTERFNNTNPGFVYNITFYATDTAGNVGMLQFFLNMSDNTSSNTPNSSRVSVSVGSTSATVTLSGFNESVNASIVAHSGSSNATSTIATPQTDFNTTQAVVFPSLTASTIYHMNITVCDFAGNCAVNGTNLAFTTTAAASSSSSSSSSSGSSGGGGVAATTSVTDSKSQVWQSVPAGSSFSLDVDKEGIAVTSVSVGEVTAGLTNVELSVGALSKNPAADEPSAKVFQYLSITKKNVPDASAGDYKVGFRVTKAWLTENSLGSGDIALYRFTDSKWNELTTSVKGTDATYVNYESDTPGFSSFAVAAKSSVAPPAAETPAEEAEEAPTAGEGAPGEVAKPVPVKTPGKAPMAWIIAGIVIVIGIVLIVIYQKSRK